MDPVNPNIAARLIERAARHPDRTAIVHDRGGRSRRITFGELPRQVASIAAALSDRGIGPGDRVVLFVPMSIDLYLVLLACLHVGATAVFVDAWAGRERLEAAVAAAQPRAFIGTRRAQLLRLTRGALRRIPISITITRRWLDLAGSPAASASSPAAVANDDVALVTFTTGSTGAIKAAARSHGFLWAQHEVLAEHLGLTESDVDLPTLPVFVLNDLACGVTSVIPDFDPRRPAEIRPETIVRQIESEHVTTTSGSPAFYQRLLRWCRDHGRPLRVRNLFTGGAPVLPPLARLLADPKAFTGEAHVVYGSSEAEPIASIAVREMLAAMASVAGRPAPDGICAGRPVPQIELRIIRACDDPIALGPSGLAEWVVARGEVGEVVVSGAHVLAGYWNDPESERRNKIREGDRLWHRTGDGAWLDAEGRLWLMGRVKQRLEREGRVWWSGPAELRACELPGVSHAAYFGALDPSRGQRAVLCVEMTGGPSTAPDIERVRAALDPIPVDELHAVRHIPRDPRHESKTDVDRLRGMVFPRGR
jgi:acyl-CoA synthetase (AMP-forming)/AMP-acid ligase II